MDGDQGALNKFEHGEFDAGLNDIGVSIKKVFTNDVAPVLTIFVKQFASDFGSQALSQAAPLAAQVISGQMTIQAAGVALLPQITADAVTDAEKDGTVALNALRVQITAASPTLASVAAPAAPPASAPPATGG